MEVPTTRALLARDMGVPAMVMAGAPGVRVVPATATPEGRMVASWPAAVMTWGEAEEGKFIVEVPATRPLEPREMGVPAMVMAGALGVSVVPAMATPFARAVAGRPAAVKIEF